MVHPMWSAIDYNTSLLLADLEMVSHGANDITTSYVSICDTIGR